MKTLAHLKSAVYARGYEDDQDGRIAEFANDVTRELFNDGRWRRAQATAVISATSGVGPYALPDDVLHIESVRMTVNTGAAQPELTGISSDDMLELTFANAANATVGTTELWAQTDEGVLTIFPPPLPGGVLSVRYQRQPVEVADDDDELDWPDSMFDLLVVGVCIRLAKRERQWDAATDFQGEFDRRLSRAKSQEGLGQRQNSDRVGFSGDKSYGSAYGIRGRIY